ncbi:Putative nuclease [Frankliniella fusca]|uniref:Nuclease n=1 Tax=Frankliniella fusca TaxID=407009 RepID=A0AAE1LAS1_9NEOP|nr:Putative nuclease [Frankliniella fusca]
MALARVAAAEIMEDEEGPGLDELAGPAWAPVTVVIDDYHLNPCFKAHFRMSRTMFLELSRVIRDHLDATRRRRRERTPFLDIMLMVIWLLATPDSYRSVALRFGVTPGTLHYFYSYIIEALRELAERYIRWPSQEERQAIKQSWEDATGFPGVIGAIDCTHVPISAPLETPADYVNRHDLHSINVQCVVDHTLLVREIHAGEVGSMNDRRVFRRSNLQRQLLRRGEDRIIEPDEHLVGDGGYTNSDFMLIPFSNNGHLTQEQQNYNRALSQARVRVENSFGLAKGKWRRLKYLYIRNPALVVDHITACFVIHNFLILNGEEMINASTKSD